MSAVLDRTEILARLDAPVLVYGETGSGKELLARALHACSQRSNRPLAVVDCGALPDTLLEAELFGYERGAFTGADRAYRGRIEAADGGTFFIDEVNSLSLAAQTKLLRFLDRREFLRVGEERPISVDVRVIAATNVPPEQLVAQGLMRGDFFHRLNVLRVSIPPLRERRDDLPILVRQLLAEDSLARRFNVSGVSREALAQLQAYSWPGNVRELFNVLRRSVVFGAANGVLEKIDYPLQDDSAASAIPAHSPSAGVNFRTWMEEREREYFAHLMRCYRTMAERARAAGLPERTFYRKLRGLELEA